MNLLTRSRSCTCQKDLVVLKRNSGSIQWYPSDWSNLFLLAAGRECTCPLDSRTRPKTVFSTSSCLFWETPTEHYYTQINCIITTENDLIYFNNMSGGGREYLYWFQKEFSAHRIVVEPRNKVLNRSVSLPLFPSFRNYLAAFRQEDTTNLNGVRREQMESDCKTTDNHPTTKPQNLPN